MRACRRCLCAVYKPSEKAMEAIKHAAETYRLAEAARPKSNKECSAVATGSRRVVSIGDVHGDCCKFLVTLDRPHDTRVDCWAKHDARADWRPD